MKLSDNFSLIEFTKSQTAERKGIENTPNEIHTIAMEALCHNILERVRSAFAKPVMINSGYRSPSFIVKRLDQNLHHNTAMVRRQI